MNSDLKPNKLKPRWSKVFSDLWGDKTRTILVVASIAVGVFAVGMIMTAYGIMSVDVSYNYKIANPPNIEVVTDPFQEDLVRVIEKVPGVEDAEGRRIIQVRARSEDGNWQRLSLIGVTDAPNVSINHLKTLDGTQSLKKDEILVSYNRIADTGFAVGDTVELELPDGTKHYVTVAGRVIDQTAARPDPGSNGNLYISMNTFKSMGLGDSFNYLYATVDGSGSDEAFISAVADEVENKLERNNKSVYRVNEGLSDEHPMGDSLLAIMGMLGALGGLITILSGSLIINTLNALLTQQLRQIGVMKLIGARSFQILGMYLLLIIIYGLIAIVITVPLGTLAGNGFATLMAQLLGSELQGFRIIPSAVIAQVLISFLIPLGAGFIPVNKGAKTNVRRAISNYRPDNQNASKNMLNRNSSWISWISRPLLLSIRNTFRQKGRLLLTIFTLTVAGAVFIAVFNVRSSMDNVMGQLLEHFLGDVNITFSQPYKIGKVQRDLSVVPGVDGVEGWGGTPAEIWDENDELVTALSISAPPQDTRLLDPEFLAGRWLKPGEEKALVVSDTIYNDFPDLKIGDTLTIKLPGVREEEWVVVGIFRFVDILGDPLGYGTFDYVSSKTNMVNQANSFRIITHDHEAESQAIMTQRIEALLTAKGYELQSVEAGYVQRENASTAVSTIIIFLLFMAILIAFVGSIGLTGTMSINVLERTREIGVMRTIGAVDTVVMRTVIVEALVIGLITWVLAIGVSFPISSALLNIIGSAMAGSVFKLTFTPLGVFIWLGVVIVLSIVASIMPARNAAKLTINEVLAYE